MTRALGRAGMLVVLALCFAPPAAANHVQCGDTITQDTALDSDLSCSGTGITVAANDVTLDLAGHTIAGTGSGVGVSVTAERAEIRRGAITGFARGVDTDGPRGTSLRHMTLEDNGAGLHCQYAPECLLEDSLVRHNGVGVRIAAADGGDPAPTVVRRNEIHHNGNGVSITGEAGVIADNHIDRNTFDGIRNDYGRPVRIVRNIVTGNGGEGVNIFFGAIATVEDNRVAGNAANGVAVYGGGGEYATTLATVDDNRINRNGGDGVLVEGRGVQAVVQRNDTDHNGDDGVDVDFDPYTPDPDCCFDVTVRANKAFFNYDLGIEAVQGTFVGTSDGGGNKAKHNGNPAQCVGVSCK